MKLNEPRAIIIAAILTAVIGGVCTLTAAWMGLLPFLVGKYQSVTATPHDVALINTQTPVPTTSTTVVISQESQQGQIETPTVSPTELALDISGEWEGTSNQLNPFATKWGFKMTLVQNGALVEGESTAYDLSNPNTFVTASLRGTLSNDGVFAFSHIEVIQATLSNPCLAIVDLRVSRALDGKLIMNGPWHSNTQNCSGTIEVEKKN